MNMGVSGYFGYMNFGDELFLKTWKQRLGEETHAIQIYEDISSLDGIIVGGGDLIIPWSYTNAYWKDEFLSRPTFVYGVGVPDPNGFIKEDIAKRYRNFLTKCKYVAVRDGNSKEFLKKYNICQDVKVVEDLLILYNNPTIKINGMKNTVGLTLSTVPNYNRKDFIDLGINIIEMGYDLLLVPFVMGHHQFVDINLHMDVYEKIKEATKSKNIHILPNNVDFEHKWAIIGSCKYYIGAKAHSVLCALSQGVPTLALSNTNKFKVFANKFGMGRHVTSYKGDFIAKFKELVDSNISRQSLLKNYRRLRNKAEEEFKGFKDILMEETER